MTLKKKKKQVIQVLHSEKIESYNCSVNCGNFLKRIWTSLHALVSQRDGLCPTWFSLEVSLGCEP